MGYDELVDRLNSAGNDARCNDVKTWLNAAGFNVKRGKGNHHVITHTGIIGFTSGSFDCGHGSNPKVKKPYIRKILNHIVKRYEKELREHLQEGHND